ncbi:MAG: helix-turn-helix transcriptional regulator [Lachnospiraceae bacterium]|nr:helix-turn-helix transcriptional regulator [Lachnospiraceae bacterium]
MEKFERKKERTVVNQNLQEVRKHGRNGFPFVIYEDDFAHFEQGLICWHWHEEMQISVVKEKAIEFSVAGRSFVLMPGDAVFINSQALHQIKPCVPSDGVIYSYIFKDTFLESDKLSEVYQECMFPILKNRELCMVIKKSEMLGEILTCYQKKEFGYQLKVKALLLELFHQVIRDGVEQTELHTAQEERDIQRVKDTICYIGQNYFEKLTLEEMASHVHISKSELCRCFRRVMKTTPGEYLIHYRIQEAARQLTATSQSITEIAAMCGFDSAGHLGRFFRRYLGKSPGEFRTDRKRMQENEEWTVNEEEQ